MCYGRLRFLCGWNTPFSRGIRRMLAAIQKSFVFCSLTLLLSDKTRRSEAMR